MQIPGNMALVVTGSDHDVEDMTFALGSINNIVLDIYYEDEGVGVFVLMINSKGRMVWLNTNGLSFALQPILIQQAPMAGVPAGTNIVDFSKFKR